MFGTMKKDQRKEIEEMVRGMIAKEFAKQRKETLEKLANSLGYKLVKKAERSQDKGITGPATVGIVNGSRQMGAMEIGLFDQEYISSYSNPYPYSNPYHYGTPGYESYEYHESEKRRKEELERARLAKEELDEKRRLKKW